MAEQLKDCPFCGSDNVVVHYSNTAFVKCNNCGAQGGKYPKDGKVAEHIDRENAIKAWENRKDYLREWWADNWK
jgi:transcription elongation factor Elf1